MSAVVLKQHAPPSGDVEGHWRLSHEAASAGLARRLVLQAMSSSVLGASDAVQRRAVLAVSELVANAIRYARPPIDLEVARTVRGWLVAVSDGEPSAPVPRIAEQLAEGGRGWLIIDRATERHGWSDTTRGSGSGSGSSSGSGRGKTVWVELWER